MIPGSIVQISCDEIGIDESGGHERIADFVTERLSPLVPQSASVVTFDGFDGVGKSRLAHLMASHREVPVFSLDDFLQNDLGYFLEAIDFEGLSSKIRNALEVDEQIIVEGCLIDAVLERTEISADFKVYTVRTSGMLSNPDAEWVRENEVLYGSKIADEQIASEEEHLRLASQLIEELQDQPNQKLPSLRRELIKYHIERRPHDHANLIVKIVHRQ